jgi:hypothetical protein
MPELFCEMNDPVLHPQATDKTLDSLCVNADERIRFGQYHERKGIGSSFGSSSPLGEKVPACLGFRD